MELLAAPKLKWPNGHLKYAKTPKVAPQKAIKHVSMFYSKPHDFLHRKKPSDAFIYLAILPTYSTKLQPPLITKVNKT
jgi:hypothetical protein